METATVPCKANADCRRSLVTVGSR